MLSRMQKKRHVGTTLIRMKRAVFLLLAAALLSSWPLQAKSTGMPVVQPGVYIGLADDPFYFIVLELRKDGSGTLRMSWIPDAFPIHEHVFRWVHDGANVIVKDFRALVPKEGDLETVKIIWEGATCRVTPVGEGFNTPSVLYNKQTWERVSSMCKPAKPAPVDGGDKTKQQ